MGRIMQRPGGIRLTRSDASEKVWIQECQSWCGHFCVNRGETADDFCLLRAAEVGDSAPFDDAAPTSGQL